MTLFVARVVCKVLDIYLWDLFDSSPSTVEERRGNTTSGASSPKSNNETAGCPLGCLVDDSISRPINDVAFAKIMQWKVQCRETGLYEYRVSIAVCL